MFNIMLWCHGILREQVLLEIKQFDNFRVCEQGHCDVLMIDMSDPQYALQNVRSTLDAMSKSTVIVMIAKDTQKLLDIVGLYVFQYMLQDQLSTRLPICLQSIQEYLINVSTICISVEREKQFYHVNDIWYVRFEDTFVYLGCENQEHATKLTSLEKAKRMLGDEFQYVNRNVMVNLNYITSITDRSVSLHTYTFQLSRRKRHQLLSCMKKKGWTL